MLKPILFGGFALCVAALPGFAASNAPAGRDATPPVASEVPSLNGWEFDFESGILWRFGHNGTPLNYTIMPQILTLKTPPVVDRVFSHSELIMRSRFSLLLEPFIQGPEHHFFGATASGILEWWNASHTLALFFSSGGGLGGMDSKGHEVKGAQGQDLNFTWFAYPGARWRFSDRVSGSLGIYYQHVSNTGLDKVNPGIDAVGPMFSVGWRF